jgi:hypothetical protein
VVLEAPDLNRDVIVRHILGKKTIDPKADGNWTLISLPASVNATFLTSPAAAGKLPADLKAEPAGDGPEGFPSTGCAADGAARAALAICRRNLRSDIQFFNRFLARIAGTPDDQQT